MIKEYVATYPSLLILLTLLIYGIGLALYRWGNKTVFLLPVVSGIAMTIGSLVYFDIDYSHYFDSVKIIHFLLGTATVALAVPLRNNFHLIREHAFPLTISLAIFSVLTPSLAVLSAWIFGAEQGVLLSLAPKSISTPFAIAVAESIGGYPPLVAAIVIITGAIVAIVASTVFKVFSIQHPIAQGFSMGMTGHGIATATAFEMSVTVGTFSALAMGLMGLSTSICLPYLVNWLFL